MDDTAFSGTAVRTLALRYATIVATRHAARAHVPIHHHRRGFLTFVLEGMYVEKVDRERRTCESGSMVLHAPGERHEDTFGAAPSSLVSVELDETHAVAALLESHRASPVVKTRRLSAIGPALLRELAVSDDATPLAVESLLLETAVTIARRDRNRSFAAPGWLKKADDFIYSNSSQQLSLSSVAAELQLDPSYLARMYRKHRGVTIGEQIRSVRLATAKAALTMTKPLADVANECGFADQSHLTRSFRGAFGITPAAYRRLVRGEDSPVRA